MFLTTCTVLLGPRYRLKRAGLRIMRCIHNLSKTCGKCGRIHSYLGSNKVFKCPASGCDYAANHDVNGARNVLLKVLPENQTDLRS